MASSRQRIAVVLFNLGGPLARADIRPFLINFFSDPNIIGAPAFVRFFLARLIAWKRSRAQAGSAYARLGYKSPLLENTRRQARALDAALNATTEGDGPVFSVHVCMRYWHPRADQVVREVAAQNPDQIILLPLYPQFSTTTSWSSLQDWERSAHTAGLCVPTSFVCCYPEEEGFLQAGADRIRAAYSGLVAQGTEGTPLPRVLFSAHGLPEKIVRGGDPYQAQCERTAQAIVARLGIDRLDWAICYQSRVGPLTWIGPSVEEELERAARDGVPVVMYPHAFVSEHVETLVEIEEEYRKLAAELGIPGFARAETVMDHPAFIQGLATMARSFVGAPRVASATGVCGCPKGANRCCMRQRKGVGV